MKKILFAAMIILAQATLAFAGTAQWTGKQIPVPPSTGYTVKCEYEQGMVKFWRLTNGACQPTVETTSGSFPPVGTKRKQGQHTPALKTSP